MTALKADFVTDRIDSLDVSSLVNQSLDDGDLPQEFRASLDANLPAMNGLELYLAIKQVTPSAVAIMITGLEKEFDAIAREANPINQNGRAVSSSGARSHIQPL